MASIAVKLPLTRDSINGFAMITSYKTLIKQNLKMLLLTNPGERVMDPDFGVGMNRFLFSNFDQTTFNLIESRIGDQVAAYMPAIRILEIQFDASEADSNKLLARITYSVPGLNTKDLLQFTI